MPPRDEWRDDEIHLAEVAALLLRGRRAIVLWALLFAVVGLLAARLPAPHFRAGAAFMPQEPSAPNLGGLSSLAGQFGVSVPGSGGTESPEFYQELLSRREILAPVLLAAYPVDGDGGAATLLRLSEVDGESEAERLDRALEWFRAEALSSSVGRTSGVVTFSVETEWPRVSYLAAQRILEEIERFNLETRQSQAQAERAFLEARLEEAEAELLAAEERLQLFLQQNRQFSNSPELQFRHDRLQRQVAMRQQVFTGLVEAYEQARIQEVRNTPVITVVEEPIVPPRREPRGTALKTLLGLILGAMLGLGLVVLRQGARSVEGPEGAALAQAWEETRADLRRLVPGRRRNPAP